MLSFTVYLSIFGIACPDGDAKAQRKLRRHKSSVGFDLSETPQRHPPAEGRLSRPQSTHAFLTSAQGFSVSHLLDERAKYEVKPPKIPVAPVDVNPNLHRPQRVRLLDAFKNEELDPRQRNLFKIVEALLADPLASHVEIDHDYLPGICYVIYSVAPFEGHRATPVATFKPANLEIGAKGFTKWMQKQAWWVKSGEWAHASHFPPGAGALRENMCYNMSKKLRRLGHGVTFSVPASVVVSVGRLGVGVLQEYVIGPRETGGSPRPLEPADGIIESQTQFLLAVLLGKSYNGLKYGRVRALHSGHLERVRQCMRRAVNSTWREIVPLENKFHKAALYSVHNSLILPEDEEPSPLTDLALRRLRLPYGNIQFAEPVVALIRKISRGFFDDIFKRFNVEDFVTDQFELVRRALHKCVLEHRYTPIQVVRFLYTERQFAFLPLVQLRLDREAESYWEEVDELLSDLAAHRVPINKYQCEHPEARDYEECKHIRSLETSGAVVGPGEFDAVDDAIVHPDDIEATIDRLWSGRPLSPMETLWRRISLYLGPWRTWLYRFCHFHFRY